MNIFSATKQIVLLIVLSVFCFSQPLKSQTYCKPVSTGTCGLLGIDGFIFNDYSAPGFLSDCYDTAFLSFGSVTTLKAGKTYQYEGGYDLGPTKIRSFAYGIWIDFNNDGKFDDATELLDSNTINFAVSYAWKGNLKIPLGVLSGQYRMRLRIVDDSYLKTFKKKNYLKKNGACNSHELSGVCDFYVKIDRAWPIDLSVANIWPSSSCSLDSSESVRVKISNSGYDTLQKGKTVIVGYTLNGKQIENDTFQLLRMLIPGDTFFHTFNSTANMALKGGYTFKAFIKNSLDSNITNDTLASIRYNKKYISTPYYENFESGIPDTWTNDPNDAGFDWSVFTAFYRYPTYYFFDHTYPKTAQGHCPYVSFANSGGLLPPNKFDSINLITPCFDISSATYPVADFWMINSPYYVPYWKTIDSNSVLYVDVYCNGKWYYNIDTPLYNIGSYSSWANVKIDLRPYKGITAIKFRANTNSKTGAATSIFFDDFRIYDWKIKDVGITGVLSPKTNAYGDSNTQIAVAMKNFGRVSQTNIPFEVKIVGKKSGVVALLKDTLRSILLPDEIDTFNIIPTFNSFSGDQYFITAYTTLSGDSVPQNDSTKDTVIIHAGLPQPIVSNSGLCSPGTLKLFVTNNTNYSTFWYDSLHSRLPLFIGDTFVTPFLSNSRKYFAVFTNVNSYNLGPANDSVVTKNPVKDTVTNTCTNCSWGQAINATDTFDLDSVTIYPAHSGKITFHYGLIPPDYIPDLIPPVTVNVVQNGKPYSRVRIPVGMRIPKGKNAKIYPTTTTGGLTYNDDSSQYPYASPPVTIFANVTIPLYGGFYSITYSYYWYLYNWRIRSYGGYSKKTPVWAEIDSPGLAKFGYKENCYGQVQFTDSSIYKSGRLPKYNWRFGDGNIDSTINPVHSYLSSGSYNASLKLIFYGGCKDSFGKSITTFKGMDTTWSLQSKAGRELSYKGNDSTLKYQWSFGDSNTSSNRTGTHTYAVDGSYHVKLEILSANGCAIIRDSQISISITSSNLTSSNSNQYNLNVVPNPYCNQTQISYSLPSASKTDLILKDMTGKVVAVLQNHELREGLQQVILSAKMFGIKPGLYFLTLMVNNTPFTIKVVQIQ